MGQRLPLNIIGGAYADDTCPWTHQDTQNMLVVMAERAGTRSPSILREVPGFYTYLDLGAGPIRGAHDVEGTLFVVSGSLLYSIDSSRTATEMGTISGVSRVAMAHNQITGGSEVAIAAGSTGYVYNTASGEFSTITDDAWVGATSLDFVDGYITAVEPGGRFWYHSDLAAAKVYSTLDRYEGETSPDKITTHIVLNRQVLVLNQKTIEIFQDTGAATNTFQRLDGVSIEVGCTSKASPVRIGGTVCFLDDRGIVRMFRGYDPVRISTHAIEQDISLCDLTKAFGLAFEERGHQVYYLTFPDGYTWGYDLSSGEWHRRQSFDLTRWRANTLTRWNRLYIAGDYNSGKLYALDWDLCVEDTDPLIRKRTCSNIQANQNRIFVPEVEIVAEVGQTENAVPEYPAITGNLVDGYVGDTVSYQYTVTGNNTPLTVTLVSGALPTGLSVNSAGLVTGSLTTAGSFTWTLRVTDANGNYSQLTDKATVTTVVGAIATTSDGKISRATNATLSNWAVVYTGVTDKKCIGYGNGTVIAMASTLATAYISTDNGASFTSHATGIASVLGTSPTDICYSALFDTWYVIGQTTGVPNNGVIYASTDNGLTWTNVTPAGMLVASSIAAGANEVVAVTTISGSGTYVTTNGTSFTKVNTTQAIKSVRYIGSEYLAVHDSAGLYYSANGTAWAARAASIPNNGTAISGDSSVVIVAGSQNPTYEIIRSTDAGATWTGVYNGNTPSGNPCSASYFGGKAVAGDSGIAQVFVSTDSGSTYTTRALTGAVGTVSAVLVRTTP